MSESVKPTIDVIREVAGKIEAGEISEAGKPVETEAEPEEKDEPEAKAEPKAEVKQVSTPEPSVKREPVKKEPEPKADAGESEEDDPVVLPGRLSAEKKAAIQKLPKEAQKLFAQELRAMESGVSRQAQALATYQKFYQGLDEVVRPHVGELQREGINPVGLVRGALQLHQDLRRQPVETILSIARDNNALDQLRAVLTGQAPANGIQQTQPSTQVYHDPRVDQMAEQLGGIQQKFESEKAAMQQRQANEAVAAWKQQTDDYGLPAHPYLDELLPEIGPLVQQMEAANIQLATQDPAAILEFAYQHALKAHPELRGAITKKREAAAKQKQIADEKARAEKARSGMVSIKGEGGKTSAAVDYKDTRALLQALSSGQLKPVT